MERIDRSSKLKHELPLSNVRCSRQKHVIHRTRYERMVKAQLPASVIAQRIALDLQCNYNDPAVTAVAVALVEGVAAPVDHVRALQVYAKTKYQRLETKLNDKNKISGIQFYDKINQKKSAQLRGEIEDDSSDLSYYGEFPVRRAQESFVDRTVSDQTFFDELSADSGKSAKRAFWLKQEAQKEFQRIMSDVEAKTVLAPNSSASTSASNSNKTSASSSSADSNESMEDIDGKEEPEETQDYSDNAPMVGSASSVSSPTEYSPELKFPDPPVQSTSSVKFTPLSALAFGGGLQRTASVNIHLPTRMFTCSGVFSPTECSRIISDLNFSEKEGALHSQYMEFRRKKELPLVRTSMRRIYIDENVAMVLCNVVRQFLPEVLPDGRKFVGIRSQMNFFRYSVGEYFTTHLDGGHSSTETGHSSEYTFVVYLNDDFEGGATRFCGISDWNGNSHEISPIGGSVAIFRQSDMKHCGVTLQKGCKYILQGMVMYGPLSYSKMGRPLGKKANVFKQIDC